jgi:Cys-rich four helix bundle protein (predicted Tat secretion target)
MNRRQAIAAAAGTAVLSIAGSALAQHRQLDHAAVSQLFETATNCVKSGLVCIDHCQQALAGGDLSLAACARDADQMVSMCGTLAKLTSVKSPYLPAMAQVTLVACQDCEIECRKHADKHPACKACAEACAACAAECKKMGT